MSFTDIFQSEFRLPKKVCVVAPGLNGKDYFTKIPGDHAQIAVSKAVRIDDIRADVWMFNVTNQDWFVDADHRFEGTRIFSCSCPSSRTLPAKVDRDVGYHFDPPAAAEEKLHPHVLRSVDGLVRGGGSIAGCAIQVAYNFGAREILLCGVDMSGDSYWDLTQNKHPSHGDLWQFAPCLQNLTKMLTLQKGLVIRSLSPTMLDVPRLHL